MSLERIHLGKLLKIFFAPSNLRIRTLRADIRDELAKSDDATGHGGDFYAPFWSDAKKHLAGLSDLPVQTGNRIQRNSKRRHLYPLLRDGFLVWLEEYRRTDGPFELIPQSVHGRFTFPELGATVKVESLLSLKTEDGSNHFIYPYFSEEPRLSEDAARLGLWLMSQALPDHRLEEMRTLDVLRSASFGTLDAPLQGNERDHFLRQYEGALADWERLRKEYG